MSTFLYFLILLCLLSFSSPQKWQSSISLANPDDLLFKRGIFKEFILTLTRNELHRSKALLKLKPIESAPPINFAFPVKIDTHKSLTYSFYVGMSAETDFKENEELSIQFEIVDETDEEMENGKPDYRDAADFEQPNGVDVYLSMAKEEIYIYTMYKYIPAGSWSLYSVINNILNVDPLVIDFDYYIGDDITVEPKEIPPFDGIDLNDDERMTGKIIASESAKSGPRVFDISLSSNCPFYVEEMELTIHVTSGGVAEMNDIQIREMMKTLELIDIGDINRISLQMKIVAFPTMLTCICQDSFKEFPDDDEIRNFFFVHQGEADEGESQHTRIFQRFVTSASYETVFFDEMSRLGRFKVKCILDNTSINNRKSYSFTAGNFRGADLKMSLMNEANLPLSPNCLTYTFKNDLDIEEKLSLSKSIDYYSNDFVANSVKNALLRENETNTYNWSDNGCFIWNERSYTEFPDSMLSFCLEAVENCDTNFKYNATEIVGNLSLTVNNDVDFKRNVDKNFVLTGLALETDDTAPNMGLIKGEFIASNEKQVLLRVTNNNTQRIACSYLKADVVKLLDPFTDEIIEHDSVSFEANEVRDDVEIDLETEGYTEQMYSVMAICMFTPGSSYHIHYTIPFPLVVFYNRKGINPREYDPVPKLDCSSPQVKYEYAECLVDVTSHIIPDYNGNFRKEDNRDDEELFNLMPNTHQIQLLQDELNFMEKAEDLVAYFDDMSYVGEMLGRRVCQETVNYQQCREHKQDVYSSMLKHFQKTFTVDNYDEILNETRINRVKTVKSFLETLFYLTNNPDSISHLSQIEFLFDFLENIDIRSLFEFIPAASNEDKIDIVKVLTASTINLIDILIYANVDGIVEETVNTQTGIILNSEFRIRQQFIMVYLLKQFWDLGETNFFYDTFAFFLYGFAVDPRTKDKYKDDWDVYTFFLNLNVEVKFRHALMEKYEGDFLHVYAYKRYPRLKLGSEFVYGTFVGLAMYDKDFVLKDVNGIEEEYAVNVTYYDGKNIDEKFRTCLILDDITDELSKEGIKFVRNKEDELFEQSIMCRLTKFGDITLGVEEFTPEKVKGNAYLVVILSILALALLIVVGYAVVLFIRKKSQKVIPDPLGEPIPSPEVLKEQS